VAERLAVDRVAIAQQPAGRRVIRKRLNDLLRGPGGRRMLRDVEVNDPPAVVETRYSAAPVLAKDTQDYRRAA